MTRSSISSRKMKQQPDSREGAMKVARQVFTEFLEQRSLRKTPERFAILDEIYSREGHFDIRALYTFMNEKNYRVSRATLYNTIDLLTECRLVTRHKYGQRQTHYERTYRAGHHDHLIDTRTGRVIEFSDPRINDIIRSACEQHSFVPHHYTLYVYGEQQKPGE